MTGFNEIDLTGMVDMHIHGSPDIRPRKLNDIEIAQQAAARGMKAILLKSHVTLTADRAALVERVVPGIRVFGGLALNHPVGGINTYAVEAAIALGAAQIWMPTLSSAAQRHDPKAPGISVLESGKLSEPVRQVLDLIASADIILGTGHVSVPEIEVLVAAAREAGVRKILITHPEHPPVEMPPDIQRRLAQKHDVLFERCFISTPMAGGATSFEQLAGIIREVGFESTVISTDLGQIDNPAPVEGFAAYIGQLAGSGFSWSEIQRMAEANPSMLLGVD